MNPRILRSLSVLGLLILLVGCGSEAKKNNLSQVGLAIKNANDTSGREKTKDLATTADQSEQAFEAEVFGTSQSTASSKVVATGLVSGSGTLIVGGSNTYNGTIASDTEGKVDKVANEPVQRKIIQMATLNILVADFNQAQSALEKLIDDYKGYVGNSDFGNNGSKREGTWTVRVPAERFLPFVNAVVALGQPQRHFTKAEDVTEESVDLESDIKNLKEKEAKLNELMKSKAQMLQDLIAWEQEVSSVRGAIARKEARQQTISRLSVMSPVRITLHQEEEKVAVVPPPPPPAGTSVSSTFWASLDTLVQFGHSVLISLVALGPWTPLIIIVIILARFALRRIHFEDYWRSSDETDTPIPPTEAAQTAQG